MPKISVIKLILCDLLRSHFKRQIDNIKRKRFWEQRLFMKRHSKREFHVLVEELKLFYQFFFKHIATRQFDPSQRCFTVFVLFFNWLH